RRPGSRCRRRGPPSRRSRGARHRPPWRRTAHAAAPRPAAEGQGRRPRRVAARARGDSLRFWDSSALVPLVVEQAATPEVERWMTDDPSLVVWTLTPVEIVSALRRLVRDGSLPERAAREAESLATDLVRQTHTVADVERVKASARDGTFACNVGSTAVIAISSSSASTSTAVPRRNGSAGPPANTTSVLAPPRYAASLAPRVW